MKQLVLIRHGESEWNRLNLFTGWTDVELTDKGLAEAHEAGRQLKAAGFDFDLAYTSYLKRAIHTLDAVLTELDRSWLPVHKAWQLNERQKNMAKSRLKSGAARLMYYHQAWKLVMTVTRVCRPNIGVCLQRKVCRWRKVLQLPSSGLYLTLKQ